MPCHFAYPLRRHKRRALIYPQNQEFAPCGNCMDCRNQINDSQSILSMPLRFIFPRKKPAARLPGDTRFQGRHAPLLLAGAVLTSSLLTTYWLWQRTSQEDTRALQSDFDFRVRETVEKIEQRMATYEQVLRGTQGLVISSEHVTQEEFRTYIGALQLGRDYPGIQGVALSLIIPRGQLAQHTASMRAQGFPDYTVHPAGERPIYTAITQIQPLAGANLRAIGFDMFAEPIRRAAMSQARDTGRAAASGKLKLIQESGTNQQPGFVMYLPVYRDGMPTATVAQRRSAILGWIGAPFRMIDLMAGIGGERSTDLTLRIYDGEIVSTHTLYYDSHSVATETDQPDPLFHKVQQLTIAGHPWTVAISSSPAFEAGLNTGKPFFIAAAGTGVSVMLALLIWLLATGRARALSLARDMTEELRESDEWLNLALDAAQLGVVDWDLVSDRATRSPRHDQIFGHPVPVPQWQLQTYLDQVPPAERDAVRQKFMQCWTDGKVDMAFQIIQPSGRMRWISAKGTVFYDDSGKPVRQIGMVADITDLKRAEQAARKARNELETRVRQRTAELVQANELLVTEIEEREKVEAALFSSRRRLSLIFDTVAEGLIVYDQQGSIIERNSAANRILGLPTGRLVNQQSLEEMVRTVHEDGSPFPAASHPSMVSLHTGRPTRDVVMGIHKADGTLTWISMSTEPLLDERSKVQMVVANISDITRKKQSEQLIWTQANFDTMTGLPNRRLFQDHLEQEIKKAGRTGLPLALMFIDIDHFKDVNDTLGHDMGDILLRQAGQRLRACVRESDIVARLGGDEFTVILSQLQDVTDVARIADGIQQKIAEPFLLEMETAYVSASIGITLYPDDAEDTEALLKNADQAMYAAKRQGRNCYHYFTRSMQEAAQARMWLANELRQALADNQFTMVYQSIVELATGGIGKAEALIRWQHPTRGTIEPSIFIPIAEETGMIIAIGDWVLHEVADQVKQWRTDCHPAFQISVNNSPVQFQSQGNNYANWLAYLKRLDLPGQSIALEITEGLLLDAASNVTDLLLEFRDAGIQVSLDDFGTGYSSLAYLKKFDIDLLKIDKSFVQNLAPGSDDMALCEAIIVMAHKLNVKVVAEGVETEQQRDLLAAVGCDYGQGYLFSRPVPAAEFMI